MTIVPFVRVSWLVAVIAVDICVLRDHPHPVLLRLDNARLHFVVELQVKV